MFKTGDYVKFGKRGQVVYMVEVIGTEDTVMIRKTGLGKGTALRTGIHISRLVLAYPVEAAIEDARLTEVAKAVTESQARQVAVAKGIDRAMTDAHSIKPQPVTPAKGRAPKGAQATRYGRMMAEALARKNKRHVHA